MMGLLKVISIGAAALVLVGSASVYAAEPSSPKHQLRKATDVSARRHERRYAAVPADDGYYYDRPVAYRPYPYVLPAPFPFGIGFDPW
jgi:hypothetical protein